MSAEHLVFTNFASFWRDLWLDEKAPDCTCQRFNVSTFAHLHPAARLQDFLVHLVGFVETISPQENSWCANPCSLHKALDVFWTKSEMFPTWSHDLPPLSGRQMPHCWLRRMEWCQSLKVQQSSRFGCGRCLPWWGDGISNFLLSEVSALWDDLQGWIAALFSSGTMPGARTLVARFSRVIPDFRRSTKASHSVSRDLSEHLAQPQAEEMTSSEFVGAFCQGLSGANCAKLGSCWVWQVMVTKTNRECKACLMVASSGSSCWSQQLYGLIMANRFNTWMERWTNGVDSKHHCGDMQIIWKIQITWCSISIWKVHRTSWNHQPSVIIVTFVQHVVRHGTPAVAVRKSAELCFGQRGGYHMTAANGMIRVRRGKRYPWHLQ